MQHENQLSTTSPLVNQVYFVALFFLLSAISLVA